MENLWPVIRIEDEVKIPKEILEEQSNYLQKMTDDLVYAAIEDIVGYDDSAEELDYDDDYLTFKFTLKSKYLDRYSYTLFAYTHGIELYPINIQLDSKIAEEIGMATTIVAEDENQFISHLGKIFRTKRAATVIGSISKMARSYKN